MKALITGSNGQLGRALKEVVSGKFYDVEQLDITNREAVLATQAEEFGAIINAAAFTNVDGAELPENNKLLWNVNVAGTGYLALLAKNSGLPFVHISTDYIFDGTKKGQWLEDDTPNPLNNYGLTKWLSEAAAKEAPKHYILRTSWVIGDGPNFVRTMLKLAETHDTLTIVDDQIGRPTFTGTLANAAVHLLKTDAEFGIYNVSNSGNPVSWADFARAIFEESGHNVAVTGVSTTEYFKDKPHAKRPLNSVFDLSKSEKEGIVLPDWRDELKKYIANYQN